MGLLFVSNKKYKEALKGKEEALSWLKSVKEEIENYGKENVKLRETVEYLEAEISIKNIALEGIKEDLKVSKEAIKKQEAENKHLIREISKANAMAYQIFKVIDEEDTKVSKRELRELAILLRPTRETNEKILKMANKGKKSNEDVACG